MQQGDVEVADVVDLFDSLRTKVIGRPNGFTCSAPSASKPNGHCLGVMVAAISCALTDPIVGRTAEFSAPNDKR